MDRKNLSTFCAFAVMLGATATCDAALFAISGGQRVIVQLNSNTGAVDRILSLPQNILRPSLNGGLAFNGRKLHWVADSGPLFYELNLEFPDRALRSGGLELDYNFPDQRDITGLAFRSSDSVPESLIAVTSDSRAESSTLQVFTPVFPDVPLVIGNVNNGAKPFPPGFAARGVDVDSSTGEIWVIGNKVEGTTRTPHLIQTDLTGAVLRELSPQIPQPSLVGGLGFDNGKMFIGSRNFPLQAVQIHEIDRTNGAVLSSWTIPNVTDISGLAGGTILPEPSTYALSCLALVGLVMRRRKRAPLSRRG